jgi:hypothetical protein
MIFSRKTDDALASLAKKLDKVVADNADKQMKTFVSFLGDADDRAKLKSDVEAFAKKSAVKEIPLVIPVEQPDGPDTYSVNPDATYTVLVYKGLKVVTNHALKDGELTKEKIEEIVKDTDKILN